LSITLDKEALVALHDDNFTSERSHCQKFVRQCIEALYGDKFQRFRAGTAKESANLWAVSPYTIPLNRGSIPGDILYYCQDSHGPYGHVVIRVSGNRVAENSCYHYDRTGKGKGLRPLSVLGTPSLIVRLPQVLLAKNSS
jgi:hypothetical protein